MFNKVMFALVLLLSLKLALACTPVHGEPNQPGIETDVSAVDQTPEQKVLDQFLGTWNWECVVFAPGVDPSESKSIGQSTSVRILGGRYVQEKTGEEVIGFFTYDAKERCYWSWGFGADAVVPEPVIPCRGIWHEATRTLEWSRNGADGYPLTIQHHFVSDDMFECSVIVKDPGGNVTYRAEYKVSRINEPGTNQQGSSTETTVQEYRGSMAGHILNANQQPMPEVSVELFHVADVPLDHKEITELLPLRELTKYQAVTDAQGAFRFDDLPPGHYAFKGVTDTELATEDMPLRITNANDGPDTFAGMSAIKRMDMTLELWPAEPFGGRVVTPEGQPIAGAEIYPYNQRASEEEVSTSVAYILGQKCGDDGSFGFQKLKKGLWQFAVTVNGKPPVLTEWYATGNQNTDIRISEAQQAQIPDTVIKTLDGEPFQLSSLRGKYVLLDFWATWCGPCRAEMPNVRAVYEEYKNDPRLILIGMDLDRDVESVKKYISENNMGWPQVFLGDSPVINQFNVQGIPCMILLDPEGKELARDLRGPAIREALLRALGDPKRQETDEQSVQGEAVAPRTDNDPVPEHKTPVTDKEGVLALDIDRDLDYYSEGFPLGLSAGQTDAPPMTNWPCKTLSAEPAYHSANIRYGYLRLGNAEDNRFVFAMDDLDQSTWIGHFDRNNNADLTDDGPPVTISDNVEFRVAIVLPSGDTVFRAYKIWEWGSGTAEQPGLRFYSVCNHQGKVNINDSKITAVAFERFNHDALYKNDGIWLDVNNDGKLDEEKELFKSGSSVTVNDQTFQINLMYP